jgi:hypothetical protein
VRSISSQVAAKSLPRGVAVGTAGSDVRGELDRVKTGLVKWRPEMLAQRFGQAVGDGSVLGESNEASPEEGLVHCAGQEPESDAAGRDVIDGGSAAVCRRDAVFDQTFLQGRITFRSDLAAGCHGASPAESWLTVPTIAGGGSGLGIILRNCSRCWRVISRRLPILM